MHALVNGAGRIFQVAAEPFEVAPPLVWVDVPDGTTTADAWDGTAVVRYVAPASAVGDLLAAVDAAAEAARAPMLTGGVGQGMSYIEKARQADAVLAAHAASAPIPAAPTLETLIGIEVDEVGSPCTDLVTVARVVAAEAAAYRAAEGRVDAVRRRAKIAIGNAQNDAGRQAWHNWAAAALPMALAGATLPTPPA